MKKSFILLCICIEILFCHSSNAHLPIGTHGKPNAYSQGNQKTKFADQCATSLSQTDLDINNVRARLQGGGDMWWDFRQGSYVIPKTARGIQPVISIFAGAVWVAGFDHGGNLKAACNTYRTSGNDWFPGPLDQVTGSTEASNCSNWDKHFRVLGADIKKMSALYIAATKNAQGRIVDPIFLNQISAEILGWPAKGNPYFSQVWGFNLPTQVDYLANFWDNNRDGIYDPLDGDYPSIYLRGCDDAPQIADEIIFWVFNDEGGGAGHTLSRGKSIGMEVQAQSFAFATNDQLNNMTFTHYRLINRSSESLDSTFFGIWTDPDLGCYADDYLGCDISKGANGKARNMMYVYNQDSEDGTAGISCGSGSGTYGKNIPILGIDFFRGATDARKTQVNPRTGAIEPLDLGMTNFMYFNSGIVGGSNVAGSDPGGALDFYRYMNSVWKDGLPLTRGGDGYNVDPAATRVKYAFSDDPDNSQGWSMVAQSLPSGDRRTVQSSGPFTMHSGAINELVIGIPWVPDQGGGAVSLRDLRHADDLAQDLFDNCFRLLQGPDAPDVEVIELENQLVLGLSNDSNYNNNYNELYGKSEHYPNMKERPYGWTYNSSLRDTFYTFEGYKIFQLAGPDVVYNSSLVKEGSDKIRLVGQVDISNDVKNIYNWTGLPDVFNSSLPAYYPSLMVEGKNTGIRHSFKIEKDLFAKGNNKSLVNHKKYYFAVVAYAHNNYSNFDKKSGFGQKSAYLESSKNIKTIIAIPHAIAGKTLNATYGEGVVITKLDGVGIGGAFVDISEDTRMGIVNGKFDQRITYKAGKGPIDIKIYNPLEVVDGDYELAFYDLSPQNNWLDDDTRWKLTKKGEPGEIISDQSIKQLNEQIVKKYGFSIAIAQSPEIGSDPIKYNNNGAILPLNNVKSLEYKRLDGPKWFSGISNSLKDDFNFVRSGNYEDLYLTDPNQRLSTAFVDGQFIPYAMCAYRLSSVIGTPTPYVSPAWINSKNAAFYATNKNRLANVNNVDIVFTSDKSKWSRCFVVETCNPIYIGGGLFPQGFSDPLKANMSLRKSASIGTDIDPDAAGDGTTGKSWFPGYAIDVETGQRLEIFFGENSGYDFKDNPSLKLLYAFSQDPTGGDMIWNPTADRVLQKLDPTLTQRIAPDLIAGCGHFIYVTDMPYANWKTDYNFLFNNPESQQNVVKNIRWTSMPILANNTAFLDYKDGLIPNDLTVKLRVDNPYQVYKATGLNNGYPLYNFSLKGKAIGSKNDELEVGDHRIGVKSGMEVLTQAELLEGKAISGQVQDIHVSVYAIDGRLVRNFTADNIVNSYDLLQQIQLNLSNVSASGIYILHIKSPAFGEKIIKWFGRTGNAK
ncbi:MAG: hypothetical protein ACOYOA_13230 [Saprospiraceae bacterium]